MRAAQLLGTEQAADGVTDSVFLAGPEVAVDVEGELCGLVTECCLHLLHTATCVDQRAGEEVAQVMIMPTSA